MPKKNQIAGLCEHRLSGARVTYHWKPSPRLRRAGFQNVKLGDDYTAAVLAAIARNEEVAAWSRRGAPAGQPRIAPRHSFADLVKLYQTDPAWTLLRASTRAEYAARIRQLTLWADDGRVAVRHIDRGMVMTLRNALVRDHRPHRTAAILRTLRILLAFAQRQGMIAANPALALDVPEPPRRRHRITIDQLRPLVAAATRKRMPHVALAVTLGFYTLQREADLLATNAFRFRAIDDLSAEARRALAGTDGQVLALWLEQRKTGAHVAIPLYPDARQAVELALADARGQRSNSGWLIRKGDPLTPCHAKTLQRDFRAVREAAAATARAAGDDALAAAYDGLQFRDLRRSGMCWLRELGVPVAMIASLSGHSIDKTMKILDTYMPRDTRSAAEGMAIAVTRQAERDAVAEREYVK